MLRYSFRVPFALQFIGLSIARLVNLGVSWYNNTDRQEVSKMARKRSKLARYNPASVKTLRDEMLKCPNPIYGQMVKEGQMSDGDMLDFALSLANSYFDGQLLESFKATAKHNMEMQTRRAVLISAAIFGATVEFTDDEMKFRRIGNDPDLITFAVQQLVNVGFSVAESMRQLEPPPPAQCEMESDIRAQLPEIVH